MTEHLPLSEFARENADDSRTPETLIEETVTMTGDEQVATYQIEDQMADLTDAIREAVQNGVDSPGSSRVLVSISPEQSLIPDDGADVDLESTEERRNLSVLGAGSKRRSDDETIGEWGISKGAIIAKVAVQIWSHDTAQYFDFRVSDTRDRGLISAAERGKLADTDHLLEGVLVEIDHYEPKSQIRTATDGGDTVAIFASGSRTSSHERASRL